MNPLLQLQSAVVESRAPPKNHIIWRISSNYGVPASVASSRWSTAKSIAAKHGRKGDQFYALHLVSLMRNDPIRKPRSQRLSIPRRPEKMPRGDSAIPLTRSPRTKHGSR